MKTLPLILAVDIGNTQTSLGAFRKERLIAEERLMSVRDRTEDEIWSHVKNLPIEWKHIGGVVIASAVPKLTGAFSRMARKYIGLEAYVVSGANAPGIAITYGDPATLGADRICACAAAFRKYGGPAIVADFGTATTIDAVNKEGAFLGGVIAPGVGTSLSALVGRTAQLPQVPLEIPPSVLGTSTASCMQAGILFGAAEAADGIIRRMRRSVGKHAVVIATGGYAPLIAEMSGEIRYIEPALVLEGARLIYERRKKASAAPTPAPHPRRAAAKR